MSLDPRQLRDYVVTPALKAIGLWSLGAEQLVMGTGAQESGFVYLAQKGGGPALGLWQMEPATYNDIWLYIENHGDAGGLTKAMESAELAWKMRELFGGPDATNSPGDLSQGAAMCRIAYYRHPEPIPAPGDIEGMAKLYKLRYNTPAGAATEAEFVANYRRLVAPIYA